MHTPTFPGPSLILSHTSPSLPQPPSAHTEMNSTRDTSKLNAEKGVEPLHAYIFISLEYSLLAATPT